MARRLPALDETGALLRPNRHSNAYVPSELAPSGEAGGLVALSSARPWAEPAPNVADCLVTRYRPWLLTVWEPLRTKAPSPAHARPWCCYLNTVIFYDSGYRPELWRKGWRDRAGALQRESRPGFVRFDQIETRLLWGMPVHFEGEVFVIGGGRVVWAPHGREGRRWWMRRGARRQQASERDVAA